MPPPSLSEMVARLLHANDHDAYVGPDLRPVCEMLAKLSRDLAAAKREVYRLTQIVETRNSK